MGNIDGELDTQEELLSLYGPLNTGTSTHWVLVDIPVVGQFSFGYATNEVQTGLVGSANIDLETMGIILADKNIDNNANPVELLLGGLSAYLDLKYSNINAGNLIKSNVSYGFSNTNGLIEDLGGQSNMVGGMFGGGFEVIIPQNPVPLPFGTTADSWFMTPGAGIMTRIGLGIDFPDFSAGFTKAFVISGPSRDEIYDAINTNRIIEENKAGGNSTAKTPTQEDRVAEQIQDGTDSLRDKTPDLGAPVLNERDDDSNSGWPDDNELTGGGSSSSNENSSSSSSGGSSSSSSSSSGGSLSGGWPDDNELSTGNAGGSSSSSSSSGGWSDDYELIAANDNSPFDNNGDDKKYLEVA